MEVNAKCIYDYESAKAISYISTYGRFNPKKVFILLNAVLLLELLCGMKLSITYGLTTQLVVALVALVLVIAGSCIAFFVNPKIQFKALHKAQHAEITYVFFDDSMKIVSKNEYHQSETEIKYSMLFKVMETSKYVCIFETKNQVFLVDKSTITNGTISDICEKLKAVLNKKYLVCKY